MQPGAKSTALAGCHGEHLKIRLKAMPVDDQANQELITFLADLLNISKKEITLVRGKTSRIKTLSVSAEVQAALEQLLHKAKEIIG